MIRYVCQTVVANYHHLSSKELLMDLKSEIVQRLETLSLEQQRQLLSYLDLSETPVPRVR